jgi:two-component system cell cycle response regulator DivK
VSPTRVMLAMANKPLLSAYCKLLACDGFEVTTATDGLWCMSLLRSFTPDVLVIDPALPWGGGDGVVAWIREDRALAQVPVLAFPTQAIPLRQLTPPFRADLYLARPPSAEVLARTLRWLVEVRAGRAEGSSPNDEVAAYDAVTAGDFDMPMRCVADRENIAL